MNRLDLETMFEAYEKEALDIVEKGNNKELFDKICINLSHLRGLINTSSNITRLERTKYENYLKKLTALENIPMQEFHFFYDRCQEKVNVQKIILTLDELTEKQVLNHNNIARSSDFDILPYHYAIIQMLHIAILNNNSYN